MDKYNSLVNEQTKEIVEITKQVPLSIDDTIPIAKALERVPKIKEKLDTFQQSGDYSSLFVELGKLGLLPIDPGRGDWIASFLLRFSGYRIVLMLFVTLCIGVIPYYVALLEGNFYNRNLMPDAMRDIGYFCISVLAMPTIVGLFGLYFGRLPRTIFQLILSNAFTVSKKQYVQFREKVGGIYKNRIIVFAPYLIATAVTVFTSIFFHFGETDNWHSLSFTRHRTIAGWLHIPMTFLVYFFISLAVLRLIGTFLALRIFFKFSANIQPLHPDSCGGLSSLGSLSMQLNYGTFMFGLISVGGILNNTKVYHLRLLHIWNIVIVCCYFIGAFIAFFLPLYSAHRRMKEAKFRTIQTINHRFHEINQELLSELEKSDQVSESKISQLESIRKVHEIASRMPVYPFNIRTISSFLGSILAPMTILFFEKIFTLLF